MSDWWIVLIPIGPALCMYLLKVMRESGIVHTHSWEWGPLKTNRDRDLFQVATCETCTKAKIRYPK